jgi:hypothetical protein
MATSYWNPTSGNDSSDGLSVANAKLTIGAAETVAGSGGTVKITTGTHSLSGLVSFAGGMTYTSEDTNNPSHLAWSDIINDRLRYGVSAANETIFEYLKITGLRGNSGEAPIYQLATDLGATLTVRFCIFNTYSNYLGGGQFWNRTNNTGVGTFNFIGNQVFAEVDRGSSTSYLFVFHGGTFNILSNSFKVTAPTDNALFIAYSSVASQIISYQRNLAEFEFTTAPSLSFSGFTTTTRIGNMYFGDNGSLVLLNDEKRGNPLFIDPSNGNLTLLPNSPAITSGGGKNYEDGDTTVKWVDFKDTGSTGAGTWGEPYKDWAELDAAIQGQIVDTVYVFKAGDHNFGSINRDLGGNVTPITGSCTFIGQNKSSKPRIHFNNSTGYFRMTSNQDGATYIFKDLIIEGGNINKACINTNNTFVGSPYIECRNVDFITVNAQNTAAVSSDAGVWDRSIIQGCTVTMVNNTISSVARPFTYVGGFMDSISVVIKNYTSGTISGAQSFNHIGLPTHFTNIVVDSDFPMNFSVKPVGSTVSNVLSGTGSTITGGYSITEIDSALFIDPENGNLNLLPNSPAITSGGVGGDVYTGETADTWFDPTKTGATSTGADPANAFGRDELAALQAAIQAVGDGCIVGVVDGTMPLVTIDWSSNISGMTVRYIPQTYLGAVFDNWNANYWDIDASAGKTTYFEGFLMKDSRIAISNRGILYNDVTNATLHLKNCKIQNVTTAGSGPVFGNRGVFSNTTLESCTVYADNSSDYLINWSGSGQGVVTIKNCNIYWTNMLANTGSGFYVENSNIIIDRASPPNRVHTSGVSVIDSVSNILGTNLEDQGSDPLFLDPVAGNFELLPNSPCITLVS